MAKNILYLNYRFKANLKYPKFDIDQESMDVRIKILESSQLEMEATKGAESEGMAEFVVNGYDVAATLPKIEIGIPGIYHSQPNDMLNT